MVGIIVPPRLLNHCVGKWNAPFMTCGEIIFPFTRGFATCERKYPVPSPLPEGNKPLNLIGMQLYYKEVFHLKISPRVCYDSESLLLTVLLLMRGDCKDSPHEKLLTKLMK